MTLRMSKSTRPILLAQTVGRMCEGTMKQMTHVGVNGSQQRGKYHHSHYTGRVWAQNSRVEPVSCHNTFTSALTSAYTGMCLVNTHTHTPFYANKAAVLGRP